MDVFHGYIIENKKNITGIWYCDGANLVFNKRSFGYIFAFGLLADAISQGKYYFSLSLSEVTGIEYFKFRMNKHAIRLTTKDKTVELIADKYKKLFQIITDCIKANNENA